MFKGEGVGQGGIYRLGGFQHVGFSVASWLKSSRLYIIVLVPT